MEHLREKIKILKAKALELYQEKSYNCSLKLWQEILTIESKNSLASVYVRRIKREIKKLEKPSLQKCKEVIIDKKIKLLIVDDSAMMRKSLTRIFETNESIKTYVAKGGKEALEIIPEIKPDVITLDMNMPGMDGLQTLKEIMLRFPRPVVMLSAFTTEAANITFDCLYYGAIDFITKPSKISANFEEQKKEMFQKIYNAAQLKIIFPRKLMGIKKNKLPLSEHPVASSVIGLGVGEGGCGFCLKVLPSIPTNTTFAILASLSMKKEHLVLFCKYINTHSRIVVKLAEDGELICKGICYLSDKDSYLKIQRSNKGFCCQVAKKPNFISAQQNINQLFFSLAEQYGSNAIGVLATGEGLDGVEGLHELKRSNGITVGQAPETCLYPETIKKALSEKCIDYVIAENEIAGMLWHLEKKQMKLTY